MQNFRTLANLIGRRVRVREEEERKKKKKTDRECNRLVFRLNLFSSTLWLANIGLEFNSNMFALVIVAMGFDVLSSLA